MSKKIIAIALIVAAIALAVVLWFNLPDTVIVQVGFDGKATNTFPKPLAIAIPFALSLSGSIIFLADSKGKNAKGLILSIVCIILMIVCLIVN